uniref:Histone acetyltransferase n=1 Tax=Macrostomum lignano TaxID=282301 RepID=A0A1I8G498_9PLAT
QQQQQPLLRFHPQHQPQIMAGDNNPFSEAFQRQLVQQQQQHPDSSKDGHLMPRPGFQQLPEQQQQQFAAPRLVVQGPPPPPPPGFHRQVSYPSGYMVAPQSAAEHQQHLHQSVGLLPQHQPSSVSISVAASVGGHVATTMTTNSGQPLSAASADSADAAASTAAPMSDESIGKLNETFDTVLRNASAAAEVGGGASTAYLADPSKADVLDKFHRQNLAGGATSPSSKKKRTSAGGKAATPSTPTPPLSLSASMPLGEGGSAVYDSLKQRLAEQRLAGPMRTLLQDPKVYTDLRLLLPPGTGSLGAFFARPDGSVGRYRSQASQPGGVELGRYSLKPYSCSGHPSHKLLLANIPDVLTSSVPQPADELIAPVQTRSELLLPLGDSCGSESSIPCAVAVPPDFGEDTDDVAERIVERLLASLEPEAEPESPRAGTPQLPGFCSEANLTDTTDTGVAGSPADHQADEDQVSADSPTVQSGQRNGVSTLSGNVMRSLTRLLGLDFNSQLEQLIHRNKKHRLNSARDSARPAIAAPPPVPPTRRHAEDAVTVSSLISAKQPVVCARCDLPILSAASA